MATPDGPRRGLLIDWGGVLTTNLFDGFETFCVDEGLEPDAVRDAFMPGSPAQGVLADFECGRSAEAAFEREFGAVLGVRDPRGLVGRLVGRLQGDEVMQDAVVAWRAAGVRTGLLSNSWGPNAYDRRRFGALFDVLVISGEQGVRKPQPEIYARAVERMDLAPHELVFVDDFAGNLEPARALGMATVHHTDTAATIAQLEELLGVVIPAT